MRPREHIEPARLHWPRPRLFASGPRPSSTEPNEHAQGACSIADHDQPVSAGLAAPNLARPAEHLSHFLPHLPQPAQQSSFEHSSPHAPVSTQPHFLLLQPGLSLQGQASGLQPSTQGVEPSQQHLRPWRTAPECRAPQAAGQPEHECAAPHAGTSSVHCGVWHDLDLSHAQAGHATCVSGRPEILPVSRQAVRPV